jgi:tryptophan synthase beta chain
VAMTDAQALSAFRELARLEGIIPALETAHALAWVLAHPEGHRQGDGELDLVCLSGRGDKDLAEVLSVGEAAASAGER